MLEKCKYDITVSSGNRLTLEQKLLFEIFQQIHKIDSYLSDTWSLYTYSDTLLELEKSKYILREGKSFDMIAYTLYFNEELSGPQQHTKVYADTFHSIFDCKISAKVCFEGFKKMNFRLSEESKIEKDVFIGVSSDPNGESMLKKISQTDIDNGSTGFDIYSNQCFIHYPYCPPRIIGYGEAYNYQLGHEKTEVTLTPVEFSNFIIPVKSIRSCGDYTIVLDDDGELYYTGYKDTFSVTNYKLTKYHKKYPDEKIIRMECGYQNVVVLTEDHKFYMEGYDYLYHIDSYSSYKYEFWYKKRPDEETEKVVDYSVGYYHHAYITDNGKLYGAGNSLLNYYNCSNDSSSYTRIPLPENVVPKQVRCSPFNSDAKFLLLFVEVDGKPQIWAGGYAYNGLLGCGDDTNQ